PTVGPKPPKNHNKCGMFGQILLAAIAIAVTVALTGPLSGVIGAALGSSFGGAVVGGALAGAAGSIVSQGFGIATGLQSSFNWSGVALSALGGAVGGGIGELGKLGSAAAQTALKTSQSLTTFGQIAKFIGSGGFLS